jgi:hypothetical protein
LGKKEEDFIHFWLYPIQQKNKNKNKKKGQVAILLAFEVLPKTHAYYSPQLALFFLAQR